MPGQNSDQLKQGGAIHSDFENISLKQESDLELRYSESEDDEKIPSGQATTIEQADSSDNESSFCLTQKDEPIVADLENLLPLSEVDSDSERDNAAAKVIKEFGNDSLADVIANLSARESPESPITRVISQSEDSFKEPPREPADHEWGDSMEIDEEDMKGAEEAARLAMSFASPVRNDPQATDIMEETTVLVVVGQNTSSSLTDEDWGENMNYDDLDEASKLALSGHQENASQAESILSVDQILEYVNSSKSTSVEPMEVGATVGGGKVDASTQVNFLDLPALMIWPKGNPRHRYQKLRMKEVHLLL